VNLLCDEFSPFCEKLLGFFKKGKTQKRNSKNVQKLVTIAYNTEQQWFLFSYFVYGFYPEKEFKVRK
jgi:hypothetical protein